MIVQMSFSGLFGGREKVAASLTEALSAGGRPSRLYLVVEDRAAPESIDGLMKSLARFDLDLKVFRTGSRLSIRLLRDIAHSLREEGCTVLHCHCYKSLAYGTLMRRIIGPRNMALVVTLHGLVLPPGPGAMLIKGSQATTLALADGVIGCSRETLERTRMPGLPSQRRTVIVNALQATSIDLALRARARKELAQRFGLDQAVPWIINVGRLTAQKNFPLYLQLARRLDQGGQPGCLLVVGAGELGPELSRQTRQMGVQARLIFTGFVRDMDSLYRAADLLVQTSNWEGTPMCLLEAMAHGLPCVAPAAGGNVDVVESGVTGKLYPVGDLNTLHAAVLAYLEHAPLRMEHGENARKRMARHFSPEAWRRRHEEFYATVAPMGGSR